MTKSSYSIDAVILIWKSIVQTGRVTSPDIPAKLFKWLHDTQGLSWREIAEIDCFEGIPAGTLCAIAKSGKVPEVHKEQLGMVRQYKDLFSMPEDELLRRLQNRSIMD